MKDWWKKIIQDIRESKEQRKENNERLKKQEGRDIVGISNKKARTLSLWALIIAIIALLFVIIHFCYDNLNHFFTG